MHSSVKGSISLAQTKFLLVKFLFTNPAHVPDYIHRIERKDQSQLVRSLMQKLKAEGPEKVRGEPLVVNAPNTSAVLLFDGLRKAGMILVDVQNWTQKKGNQIPKEAVLFVWTWPEQGFEDIDIETSAFTDDVVWFCHTWKNPTKHHAVDFVGRQTGQKAKYYAVVSDGEVVVKPSLAKSREHQAILDELDELM